MNLFKSKPKPIAPTGSRWELAPDDPFKEVSDFYKVTIIDRKSGWVQFKRDKADMFNPDTMKEHIFLDIYKRIDGEGESDE